MQISESHVRYLYQQVYLPLLACRERQYWACLVQSARQQDGLIIALDGLAPEGGEPQLWFIRELLTGLTLRSGWLSRFDQSTFEAFLEPLSLKKRMGELQMDSDDLMAVMDDCAEALVREELERGVALMERVIRLLPLEGLGEICAMVLRECAERLEEFGARRIEYVLLTLHAMNAGVVQRHFDAFTRIWR